MKPDTKTYEEIFDECGIDHALTTIREDKKIIREKYPEIFRILNTLLDITPRLEKMLIEWENRNES